MEEIGGTIKSEKFLRDTAINLMTTGKDGISAGLIWFFWIVATHPYVEAKILEEIKERLLDNGKSKDLNINGLSKLVYLHGARCETLRLFPPIPFEHNFQFNMIFFLVATLSGQIQQSYALYTQWEGWRADGVKIA